ncbi:hypothetical protein GCM10009693_16360 [Leucobacter chromiireducens subsp. chromiireducens]
MLCGARGATTAAPSLHTLMCMASIPFTLAALATSAVPGLTVFGVREHTDDSRYAAAVITTEDAELLVRVPRTQAAEVQQSAEVLGRAALTEGPRRRLPFEVPETLGMTRAGETRAVVSTFVDGERFEAEDLADDALLLQPIAEAISAIHELPLSVAQNGGLPVHTAQDLRLIATRLIDRAEATRLLPETVLQRWQRTVEAAELWDFAPTTVHGSLDAEQLRVTDGEITGVVGWGELAVGDPAQDLSWLLAPGSDICDAVIARYATLRNAGSVAHIRARAALYHELEVARWLLHGTESHDEGVIDDAVAMLDRMVGVGGPLAAAFAATQSQHPLDEAEVTALLADTPTVHPHLSDTAAVEALDEDRMFGHDTEFVEPLSAAEVDAQKAAAQKAAAQRTAPPAAAVDELADAAGTAEVDLDELFVPPVSEALAAEAGDTPDDADDSEADLAATEDQLTEPLDASDLPSARDR